VSRKASLRGEGTVLDDEGLDAGTLARTLREGLARRRERLRATDPFLFTGKVERMVGLIVEARGPGGTVGELCRVRDREGRDLLDAEVVGFREGKVLLMPLSWTRGVGPGCEVLALGKPLAAPVGISLTGRILDGLGRPADGKPLPSGLELRPVENDPPHPLERRRITEPLGLGIKAIDGILTCGKGQRMGIFSGSGVGKSTLLGMIARFTQADINVIALVGERGREVREFIERDLGEEGLRRSVVVVATSDEPAMIRVKAALVATTIAEFFRDLGMDVLFMLDSVTRFAMAQREIGLAAGEPPTTRGYPPSVFALLPRLMERTGCGSRGTITALYTVLVEGDDMNEPIADTSRSILDGHVVLSREIAARNHYPAIDILHSVSRLASEIVDEQHREAADWLRRTLAVYRTNEDLINIGAYRAGSNPEIDHAIRHIEAINRFLRQETDRRYSYHETVEMLLNMHREAVGER
jgi:flagellum-specific ATP synthase